MASSYMKLTKTDAKFADGTYKCLLQMFDEQGEVRASWTVCTGQGWAQVFRKAGRNVPGSMEPLPQGSYYVHDIDWAGGKDNWNASHGAGLGPVFVPIVCAEEKRRGDFGIHNDHNRNTAPGCFDIEDTEVLTDKGWVSATEITESHKVAQLNDDQEVFFESPLEIIKETYNGPMCHVTARKLDALVTPNHRFLGYSDSTKKGMRFVTADTLTETELRLPLSGIFDGPKIIEKAWAQLFIAFLADGYHEQSSKSCTAFHFRKQRKIDRIQEILKECGLEYRLLKNKDGTCVIKTSRLDFFKDFDPAMALSLSLETKLTMLREIEYWDGSPSGTSLVKQAYFITTKNKNLADFYQLLAITSGWGCSYKLINDSRNADWSMLYGLNIVESRDRYSLSTPEKNQGSLKVDTVDYSGTVFCLKTSSSNFLVKHRGYTYFTGNSAGCVVTTSLADMKDLVAWLRKLDPRELKVDWGL